MSTGADGPKRVLHVGDGAHARTAALFALKTKAENVSVDPVVNAPLVQAWRDQFQVERFSVQSGIDENVLASGRRYQVIVNRRVERSGDYRLPAA